MVRESKNRVALTLILASLTIDLLKNSQAEKHPDFFSICLKIEEIWSSVEGD
jgi:hypothetical protein